MFVLPFRPPVAPERLHALAKDPDVRVRFTVAERLPLADLALLVGDGEAIVREAVEARLKSEGER